MEIDNNIEQAPAMDISSPALESSGDNFTTDYSAQTTVEDGKKSNLLLKVALIGTSALVFLSSCNQTPAIVQPPMEAVPTQLVDSTLTIDNTPEKETTAPEVEITAMPTITEEDNDNDNTATIEDNTIIGMEEDNAIPEKEFDDYEALDLMTWEDFELVDVKEYEQGQIIETTRKTLLYGTPLLNFFLEDNFSPMIPIREMLVPEGLSFKVLNEKTIQDSNGRVLTIATLEGSLSETYINAVSSVVTSYKDENGEEYQFTKEPEIESAVPSMTVVEYEGREEKEIEALLYAAKNFLNYQIENGPFKKGQTYSLSEIMSYYPYDEDSEFYDLALYDGALSYKYNTSVSQIAAILYRILDGNDGSSQTLAIVEADTGLPGAMTMGPSTLFNNKYTINLIINSPNSAQNREMLFTPSKDFYIGLELFITNRKRDFESEQSPYMPYILTLYEGEENLYQKRKEIDERIEIFNKAKEADFENLFYLKNLEEDKHYSFRDNREKIVEIINILYPPQSPPKE